MVHNTRNCNFASQKVHRVHLAEKVKQSERKCDDDLEISMAETVEDEYEVGDMVWAKVKSHPWWPGLIFNEEWAVPSVGKRKKAGHVLIAFFGDSSYGWFDPKELLPFETHYVEKSKQTKAPAFLDAVEDAEVEISRRAELGLACLCHNLLSLTPINYFGCFYSVNLKGYDSSGVYSMKQIQSARDGFQPAAALSFVRQMALMPGEKMQQNVDWIQNVATVCAFRKAVFEEIDEMHVLSHVEESENLTKSCVDLEEQEEEVPFQDPRNRSIEISESTVQRKESEVFYNNTTNPGGLKNKSSSMIKVVEHRGDVDKMRSVGCITSPLESDLPGEAFVDAGQSVGVTQDDLEHPGQYLNSEKAVKVDKRKRKIEVELQCSVTHGLKDGMQESLKISPLDKSGETSLFDKEKSVDDKQVIGSIRTEDELHQRHADLLALALNPFHGVEQNIPAIVEKFVLQFRSTVYQKSLAVAGSSLRKLDDAKSKSSGFLASTISIHSPLSVRTQGLPLDSIPPKKRLKPEDYKITDQQGGNYDNREEISERVRKGTCESKPSATEEKVKDQKQVKPQDRNQEKIDIVHVTNQVKDVLEKPKTSMKSAKPTLLTVRFPSKSALPSISELKAKFVRFGPLDLSATHVSWKSSTCIVAFKCKSDALAAYEYAIQNKYLFGNANIIYKLETPLIKSHKSGNQPVNQTCGMDLQSPTMITGAPVKSGTKQTLPSKSAVKESESKEREQLVVKSNVNHPTCNYPCIDSRTPSVATPSTSIEQNLQQSIIRPLLVTLPDEISNTTKSHLLSESVEPCNDQSFEASTILTASASRKSIDISQQMLNSLIRCNEIINNLKSALGYVPFHL